MVSTTTISQQYDIDQSEFTQPMYMLTTLIATSYCRDGGSGYHMAVAHSYCYELLISVCYNQEHIVMRSWYNCMHIASSPSAPPVLDGLP